MKILDTPNGKIVKELLNSGAKLESLCRGMGTLEKKGNANYVKMIFTLQPYDIVAPSTPQTFVEGIMEGMNGSGHGILKESEVVKIHRLVPQINRILFPFKTLIL